MGELTGELTDRDGRARGKRPDTWLPPTPRTTGVSSWRSAASGAPQEAPREAGLQLQLKAMQQQLQSLERRISRRRDQPGDREFLRGRSASVPIPGCAGEAGEDESRDDEWGHDDSGEPRRSGLRTPRELWDEALCLAGRLGESVGDLGGRESWPMALALPSDDGRSQGWTRLESALTERVASARELSQRWGCLAWRKPEAKSERGRGVWRPRQAELP